MNARFIFHEQDSISDGNLPLLFDLLIQFRNCYGNDEVLDEHAEALQDAIKDLYYSKFKKSIWEAPGNLRNAGRKSSLSDEDRKKILDMHKKGKTQIKIAEEMGISRSYVQQILSLSHYGTRSYSTFLEHLYD